MTEMKIVASTTANVSVKLEPGRWLVNDRFSVTEINYSVGSHGGVWCEPRGVTRTKAGAWSKVARTLFLDSFEVPMPDDVWAALQDALRESLSDVALPGTPPKKWGTQR